VTVIDWIRHCRSYTKQPVFGGLENVADATYREQVLKSLSAAVGEHAGNAAARLWLYEDLSGHDAEEIFLMTLKYYLARESRLSCTMDELNLLSATAFEGLIEWAGRYDERQVNQRNIGIAYYRLQRWDDCIHCLTVGG
jgi:hypothetical protein